MRKIPASLAVLGLISVGLVGCSLPGTQTCSRSDAADPAALDPVTVSGSTDEVPDVELYLPFRASSAAFEDAVVGDGTAITTGAQLILIDVSITSGETGENIISTAYDGDLSRVSTAAQWIEIIPAFEDALMCATEGSRIVVAVPPGGIEPATASSLEIAEDDSAVAVIDLRKVYLSRADGADQFNGARGMPTVVRAPDGRPGVIIPEAAPPTDLVTQTLKKGDGPVVTGDQPVRVHYTVVSWDERQVEVSTWDDVPKSVGIDELFAGSAEALTGATVGSQVLAVVPPVEGAGAADSTLVFVIDILGLDQAAPAADAG